MQLKDWGAVYRSNGDNRTRSRHHSLARTACQVLAPKRSIILAWISKYTVTVSPGKGLVFVTRDDYATARAFAERLANFLRFPLENHVPDANRKYDRKDRLHH